MPRANWAHNTLYQMSLVGRCQGQAVVNVHHFETSAINEALLINDGVAIGAGTDLATDWLNNMLALWRHTHTLDYFLDKVRVQVLERPGNIDRKLVATDTTTGLPQAGDGPTNIGPSPPAPTVADDMAASGVVRWRSTLAGKKHRGRTYVGPLADVSVNAGILAVEQVTAIGNYAAALLARYAPGGGYSAQNLTIYSRPYSTGKYQYTRRVGGLLTVITPPDYNGDSTFVTSQQVDTVARVQRRREIGVGS